MSLTSRRSLRTYLPLLLILLGYMLLRFWYIDFVPLWDSWEYYEHSCILTASQPPFSIWKFDCHNHVSMAFVMIHAAFQLLSRGSLFLLHLPGILMGILAIWFFYKLLTLVLEEENYRIEILLATFIFAFYPMIVANATNINLDYGVVCFFIPFLYMLLTRRKWWTLLFGTLMVFSKEPGIGIYGISLGMYVCMRYFEVRRSRISNFQLQNIVLIIPVLLFGLRTLWKLIFLNQSVFWLGMNPLSGAMHDERINEFVLARLSQSYLITIFLLQFNWVLSLGALTGGIVWFFRVVGISGLGGVEGIRGSRLKHLIYLFSIFIPMVMFLTWYKTFTNPRYFLSLYPLLLLFFTVSLCYLIRQCRIRQGFLVMMAVVYLFANFYTFDPVSRGIFGTFRFGDHELLHITSFTGECCGYGRDQLAYNLQYTYYHYLLDAMLRDIKPVYKQTEVAFGSQLGPYYVGYIDNDLGYRTTSIYNSNEPHYDIMWNFDEYPDAEKPAIINFLDLPTLGWQEELDHYLRYYTVAEKKEYDIRGYTANRYTLMKK